MYTPLCRSRYRVLLQKNVLHAPFCQNISTWDNHYLDFCDYPLVLSFLKIYIRTQHHVFIWTWFILFKTMSIRVMHVSICTCVWLFLENTHLCCTMWFGSHPSHVVIMSSATTELNVTSNWEGLEKRRSPNFWRWPAILGIPSFADTSLFYFLCLEFLCVSFSQIPVL